MIRAKVRQWVEQHALLPKDSNIVAACSGGPDSLVLVDLLDRFRQNLSFSLFVAHFDHRLRGEESSGDAEFVRLFCLKRGLPFFAGDADTKDELRRDGGSLEEAARRLRYGFLRQVAADVGNALIATGHHQDDQAETVLLNLIRGSGGRGLGAMRNRHADIIRPLLCLSRSEIESYCLDQKLNPRQDSSNSNVEFYRNRVRHELVPLLKQRFNSAVANTLCRTAVVLSSEQDFLRQYVLENLPKWAVRLETGYVLDAGSFSRLHEALQRQLLMVLLEQLRGDCRNISFTHVEKIRGLFLQEQGAHRVDLPGSWQARKSYQNLFIETTSLRPSSVGRSVILPGGAGEKTVLNCPGDTVLVNFNIAIRCSLHAGPLPSLDTLDKTKVAFDCASLDFPLFVRQRCPGDLLQPLGALGKRKLKKILIDLKVPREIRDLLPVVFDGSGLLWLVGLCRSERGRLTEKTRQYILIEII